MKKKVEKMGFSFNPDLDVLRFAVSCANEATEKGDKEAEEYFNNIVLAYSNEEDE